MKAEIHRCFIASPSDTDAEREACKRVCEKISKQLGRRLGFRIEAIGWDTDSRPAFDTDGQAVINKQLLDEIDLFVGILKGKFGRPTPRAGSGTEEEFNIAYAAYTENQSVELLIYFSDEPIKPSEINATELIRISDFKERISQLGALYGTFDSTQDFESKLERHLTDYFIVKFGGDSDDQEIHRRAEELAEERLHAAISHILDSRLRDALNLYNNQPRIWADPVISASESIASDPDQNYNSRIDIGKFIENPHSCVISAPAQFGLTSLAHHLCKCAWSNHSYWAYINFTPATMRDPVKAVARAAKDLGVPDRAPSVIVLDSWKASAEGAKKTVRTLTKQFPNTPIMVMHTEDGTNVVPQQLGNLDTREFTRYRLLALPRTQVRKIVQDYNNERHIGDEDKILDRLMKDLAALNIHRTAVNCITLLKVTEAHFEESPVNRTKMIEMILFILFNLEQLPTYKSKPDVKDCEYVLGRFCEEIIRSRNEEFTREKFLSTLSDFCQERLIDLDVHTVFDTLYENRIIVVGHAGFCFRASYWIYYFAARRMYSDENFRNYIIEQKNYTYFPEIIEFYTGIDRDRGDLLSRITEDLHETRELVRSRVGLPEDFNPLEAFSWNPDIDAIRELKRSASEDIDSSNLPAEVKDSYADRGYDQRSPYHQGLQSLFDRISLTSLIFQTRACCRALRNSDYVEPSLKQKLLAEISESWVEIGKVLFAVSPILARDGSAKYDNVRIFLTGNFPTDFEERMSSVLQAIPINLMAAFRDDIYSNKFGPLLYSACKSPSSSLAKHLLMLMAIDQRPTGWGKEVESYIHHLQKDAYYLADVLSILRLRYRFAIASNKDLSEMRKLIKVCIAKHEIGERIPSPRSLRRVPDSNIPKREEPKG